ncbi:subtilisin-like protease SBT1.2 [Tanacetum coccineum]
MASSMMASRVVLLFELVSFEEIRSGEPRFAIVQGQGFAAQMSAKEAKAMKNMTQVLSVRPQGLWKDSNYAKGTIIGVLDTGITPGHLSFHDKGMPPAPSRWKGKCEVAACNNKLIGIRNFVRGSSAVDQQGHGTHTSSTAAGNFVDSCPDSNIIAGMDAAIEDGVDVISLSLGGQSAPFYLDSIAIGTFAAIQKGIFVTCSAGNSGPSKSTLSNEAPWILTVGASTMDRKIRTTVYLGNNKLLDGESLYQPKNFHQKLMPLVYPGRKGDHSAAQCSRGSLDNINVKGKVVLCDMAGVTDGIEKGMVVKEARGAAMILANKKTVCPESTVPDPHVLPASNIGYNEGVEIKKYLSSSTSSPFVATILHRGTILGVKSAPEVACFSSRGPNLASPGILKPDIIGPGVDILAAWPQSTKVMFNLLSGTSMACPHLAGVAALLKRANLEWSPAAIKSAIMTTATQESLNGKAILDERELPADVFAIGAGHVNPSKANDPGLVFDIKPDDYILYLCGLGYTTKQIRMIAKKTVTCIKSIPEAELNYPSFSVMLKRGDSKTYSRTVTNVGIPRSRYTIGNVSLPRGVRILVEGPSQGLTFRAMYQKLTYKVTFRRDIMDTLKGPYGQGYMTLVSGKYSKILNYFNPFLFADLVLALEF